LRVEVQEEDIKSEIFTSNWIATLGSADVEAASYFFVRCTINLKNTTGIGAIAPLTLIQFY
jgi:hypothetical protein